MGFDLDRHQQIYENWKKGFLSAKGTINQNYIEEDLTRPNTRLFLQYITDMEAGINVSKTAKKGGRSPKTLNRLRSKVKGILKGLQEEGVSDVSKLTPEQLISYFNKWKQKGHSNDYAVRFRSFWRWWMTKNRREGKLIPDICEDLDTSKNSDSQFVWLTKHEFDQFRKYFDKEKQVLLMFCWDTIIRSPGELSALKVEDVYQNVKGEVWINIRDEISKTFGRKFNLVYSGDLILDHIKGKEPHEPLFVYSSPMFNKQMQKVAFQLWENKKSLAGEYYKNITLYDLRHSGAIHYRQLFQKTGQSLDSLRHRGGWTDFRMINYYTKLLGLDGHIDKEKTLLEEDKTNLEKELEKLKSDRDEELLAMKQQMKVLLQGLAELKQKEPSAG